MTLRRDIHVKVGGRVQGVGYRAFVVESARELGLDGWVRNRLDGSVEAVLAGSPEAIDQVRERLGRGPPAARVTRVEILAEGDGSAVPAGFDWRPTA